MSIVNSTRLAWLSGVALIVCLLPVQATAEVSPKVRQRLLKNARPGLQRTCTTWSTAIRESWLQVEEVGNLNCMRKSRIPEAAERLVRQEFVRICTEDMTGKLAVEIDRHPKELRDYYLPDVQGEEMLAMYARSLYPTYQRYCADGPSPALGPVDRPEKEEIAL